LAGESSTWRRWLRGASERDRCRRTCSGNGQRPAGGLACLTAPRPSSLVPSRAGERRFQRLTAAWEGVRPPGCRAAASFDAR
jgi:hypothetical protein